MSTVVVLGQDVPLRTFKTKLTAQSAKPAKNFLDLQGRKVFDIIGASYEPSQIDMYVIFGSRTKTNLMLPSSSSVASFGEYFKENIENGWDIKNKGVLINLGNEDESAKIYSKLKSYSDLESLIVEKSKSIQSISGYQLRENGPTDNLIKIEKGDVILFQSIDRGFSALGRILEIEDSNTGKLIIEWKTSKI